MKATGIIRRIDELGRIVIPKEIRRTLHLREGDPLEIYLIEGGVAFKKYSLMGECVEIFEKCYKSLSSLDVPNAWYDRDKIVAGDLELFPSEAPDELIRNSFTLDGITFFPLWVDGDLCGYLAVSYDDAEKGKNIIEAIVRVSCELMKP